MVPPFHTTRRVEFRDTDAAGMVHFSVFFTYMEQAEHELLRQRGLSVMSEHDGETVSWPRVACSCQYREAARFEDVLDIEVRVTRVSDKTITFGFTFRREGQLLAEGEITTVCCRIEPNERPRAVTIPDWFLEKLGVDGAPDTVA